MANEITNVLRAANTATATFQRKSGLSWRQRRKLGLTRQAVFSAVRELRASEDWDDNADRAEIAQTVAVMLTGHPDYAEAYCELGESVGFDWESILDFIEQMIPLILMLLELFSFI